MLEITPDLLKKIQEKELEILKEFDRVCTSLNLRYMLASGTALGAVRHHGFIPWDDDIDVLMPRVDYNLFRESAQRVMSPKFFVQNYQSDPGYLNFFMKVRANSTLMQECSAADSFSHQGIYIDVFPLDRVSDKAWARTFDTLIHSGFNALKYSASQALCFRSKSLIRRIFRLILHFPAKWIGVSRLNQWEDRFRARGKDNPAWHTTPADCLFLRRGVYFRMSVFDRTIRVPFEDGLFPIATDYDSYLGTIYGDYMTPPPENKRIPQHQLNDLRFDVSDYQE